MYAGLSLVLTLLAGVITVPAMAQGLGFGLGMQDVVVRAGGGAGITDIVSTPPAAAYSFRKLKSTYTGPAVKLRRTTGGTQDISFVGSDFDAAAAATFCAATTCFIDTWYDQTGLGRHAVQATTANQPAYIADCGTGKPCVRATTATQMLASSSITWAAGKTTLSVVGRRTAGTTVRCYFAGKGNSLLGPTTVSDSWVMTDYVTEYTSFGLPIENVWHTGIAIFNDASSVLRIDATESAAGTIAGSVSGTTSVFVAGGAGTTCEVSEAIIRDNYALTASERATLANNQRNYWGF